VKLKELAAWLKIISLLSLFIILFLTFAVVPSVAKDMARSSAKYAHLAKPFTYFVWMSAIVPIIGVFISWSVFNELERDNSFCVKNAISLKRISQLALAEAIYYFIGIIFLLVRALLNLPVLITAGVIVTICLVITVCAAAISHLIMKAAILKDENDLTV